MENREIDLGQLFAVLWQLAKRNIGPLLLVGGAMFGIGMVHDLYFMETLGANFIVTIGQFVIGYFLSRALAREIGLVSQFGGPGFGSYFGLSFLYGLGTGLAFLLLLIPGIFLSVKWLLAFPILFDEEEVTDGTAPLGRSWDLVSGSTFWRLLGAYLVSILLTALSIYIYFRFGAETGTPLLIAVGVANVAIALNVLYSLLLGFAAYELLRNDDAATARIFA